MTIRKALFWVHLIAGCSAGLVILVMSVTGVILMYERQLIARSERGAFRTDAPSAGARHLPVEELLQKIDIQRKLPASATLTLRSDPREPAEITIGREPQVFVNPYSGQVLPSGESSVRPFFQAVRAWHRYLGAEGERRPAAKAITGACNLVFLGLILSGAYLWLPKAWSMQHLRPIVLFRQGLSGKARDFNWHNVFGIWAIVPLFLIVLSAVPMSYSWANDLLYRWTGSPLPQSGRTEREEKSAMAPADVAGLNRFLASAQEQSPGWQSITFRLPRLGDRTAIFSIDAGDGGQPQKKSTLTIDRTSGAVTKKETFADNNAGRRLRLYARFLHTGEALGIVGQTIAGIASIAGVMLVWTGISLALRRLAAWNVRRRNQLAQYAGQA